jgi:CheY-like chemotaxis protein
MTSINSFDPLHAIGLAAAAMADDALRKILVVDDESTIRLALSRFLRTRGFEVDVAESGDAALGALNSTRYALMLCDLRMPGMTGLEMVPRALAVDPDIAIIMLTAVNDASSATDALSSGAFDYLTKPVELPRSAVRRRTRCGASHPAMERRALDRLIREEVAVRTLDLEREKAGTARAHRQCGRNTDQCHGGQRPLLAWPLTSVASLAPPSPKSSVRMTSTSNRCDCPAGCTTWAKSAFGRPSSTRMAR